jgi:chromosome partitioning protein
MRVALINAKGGTGKTTLAIHLARDFSKSGRTLLCDMDPQGSSLAWASLSEQTPFSVGRSLSPGFEHCVYDMPPALPPRLPDVDLFVVPTQLDSCSFVVFLRVMELLMGQGKKVLPVATRVNMQRKEHRERLQDELLLGACVIRERAAFATYYAMGTTVYDMTLPHAQKARHDLDQLTARIGATP